MYTLTIDYEVRGIGKAQMMFTHDDPLKAMNAFLDQVKAYMNPYNRNVHIKLVKDSEVIAEYKIY